MSEPSALAAGQVRAVRDDPPARLRLAAAFYSGHVSRYGRAELSFLRWEIARGVLDADGSPWWRAVNDRLLRDKAEAVLLDGVAPSAPSVALWADFLRSPSPVAWYRAHNASVVSAYLAHEDLAHRELPAERFMINVALVRVLYTHALVAGPRLALGAFAPLGRLLGDPRGGSVRFFLDMRRAFPEVYPLTGLSVERLISMEGRLAQALDFGIIVPRLPALFAFAATSLGMPEIDRLLWEGAPCYAAPTSGSAWIRANDGRLLPRLAAVATRARR
ncbi:hypothetical protein ACIBG8_32160 [Nonomuraea sp. NPDC050556]|uniref:hypothetical protein n=1 Tax=Nonomuraea sp. NPDC050556 TaxID=3364369 RepID=UPI0037949670